MATDYLESLSDDDFQTVQDTLASGAKTPNDAMDAILDEAPKNSDQLVLYKYYEWDDSFTVGGTFVDPTYPVLTSTKLDDNKTGVAIFAFVVPADSLSVIQLSDDAYMFERSLTVAYLPEQDGVVPAAFVESLPNAVTASATITFMGGQRFIDLKGNCYDCGMNQMEEFFNKCHGRGGRFCEGGATGGRTSQPGQGNHPRPGNQNQHRRQGQGGGFQPRHGGGGGGRPAPQKTKLQKVATVARDITAIVAVATAAFAIVNFAQNQQTRAKKARADELQNKYGQKPMSTPDLVAHLKSLQRAAEAKVPNAPDGWIENPSVGGRRTKPFIRDPKAPSAKSVLEGVAHANGKTLSPKERAEQDAWAKALEGSKGTKRNLP